VNGLRCGFELLDMPLECGTPHVPDFANLEGRELTRFKQVIGLADRFAYVRGNGGGTFQDIAGESLGA
jgi:hypothetical protein